LASSFPISTRRTWPACCEHVRSTLLQSVLRTCSQHQKVVNLLPTRTNLWRTWLRTRVRS